MNDQRNKNEEVDDLLGEDSDEEEDKLVEDNINDDITKINKTQAKNELNDLLGESDEDDDDNKITDEGYKEQKEEENKINDYVKNDNVDDILQNSEINNRSNELDQILGKKEVTFKAITKELKSKTNSKILLPSTYKPDVNQNSYFVRTPNFIKIQVMEYNEMNYNPDEEKSILDGSIAIVRWRFKRNELTGDIEYDMNTGKAMKESNARMIQWNDGSMQLVVGDAVFQCKGIPVDNW